MNAWRDWRVLTWTAIVVALSLVLLAACSLGSGSSAPATTPATDSTRSQAILLDRSIPQGIAAGFEAEAVSAWLGQVAAISEQASKDRAAVLSARGKAQSTLDDQAKAGFDAVSSAARHGQGHLVSHPQDAAGVRRDTILAINDVVGLVLYGAAPAPDSGENYHPTDTSAPQAATPGMPDYQLNPTLPATKEKK